MSARRHDRLADQLRAEVARMIESDLKDPRIGFTTVTRAELSQDLSHAHILVSVLGDAETQKQTLDGLASATRYVRHEVARRMGLRRAPEVEFRLDRGPEEAMKIEGLLREIHPPSDE